MDIQTRLGEIFRRYKANDYVGTIEQFYEYLECKDAYVYAEVYDIYIRALIRLGMLADAKNEIKKMETIFPGFYDDLYLAYRCISCDMDEELDKLLKTTDLTSRGCYILGKNCFYNKKYDFAKKLFSMCLDNNETPNNNVNDYIRRMNLYSTDDTIFKSVKLSRFKAEGGTLEPGHIVRVDRLRSKYKYNHGNTDPSKIERPYLIWKIIGNRLYAFPLSTNIKFDAYVLNALDYPNSNMDRRIKDRLVCLEMDDVQLVDDKLNLHDFEFIIKDMYSFFKQSTYVIRDKIKLFMRNTVQEIGADNDDIIVVEEDKKKEYYYVIDVDKDNQCYKTLRVQKYDSGALYALPEEEVSISMQANIVDVLDSEKFCLKFPENTYVKKKTID